MADIYKGSRKTSVARVRLIKNGTGKITINKRDVKDYFSLDILEQIVLEPFTKAEVKEIKYDIEANVYGGGLSGQAGAIKQAVARALVAEEPELKPMIKKAGLLTCDARRKERKKYGLKKARKAPQYSKR